MSFKSFSGNRTKREEPPLMMPQPKSPVEVNGDDELHPTLAAMSRSLKDADELRAALNQLRDRTTEEIRQLRADLEVERRHLFQVNKILSETRAQLEIFRNYAVTIRTHLEHLAEAAIKANDMAMRINSDPVPDDESDKKLDERAVATEVPS